MSWQHFKPAGLVPGLMGSAKSGGLAHRSSVTKQHDAHKPRHASYRRLERRGPSLPVPVPALAPVGDRNGWSDLLLATMTSVPVASYPSILMVPPAGMVTGWLPSTVAVVATGLPLTWTSMLGNR